MSSSFLVKAFLDLADGKLDDKTVNRLKEMFEDESVALEDDHNEDCFGIVLKKHDIITLIDETSEKFKCMANGEELPLGLIVHIFDKEDFEDEKYPGFYMLGNSFNYNLSQHFLYNGLEFTRVCCRDNKVVLLPGDNIPLFFETLDLIRKFIPDIDAYLLAKKCGCT